MRRGIERSCSASRSAKISEVCGGQTRYAGDVIGEVFAGGELLLIRAAVVKAEKDVVLPVAIRFECIRAFGERWQIKAAAAGDISEIEAQGIKIRRQIEIKLIDILAARERKIRDRKLNRSRRN